MTTLIRKCRVHGKKPEIVYEGDIRQNFQGTNKYATFYGIPYARKPAGDKRYQPAEPLTSIDELINVDKAGSSAAPTSPPVRRANVVNGKLCIQMIPPFDTGSADCLYLNVSVPNDPDLIKDLVPVLVVFHGGGFMCGGGHPGYYSPENIVQHDVVLVSVNYRLGLYGFTTNHTEEFPGNIGLKDQVLALHWIQDNIQCFKGDPNNVTISGWSAGGTCVNLHLISDLSKGLFHKAIVHSGGIFCPWGYRGHHIETMNVIFRDEKCQELLHMEEKSQELQSVAHGLLIGDRDNRHSKSMAPFFGPVTEKIKEGAFLPNNINTMMENAKVDDIPIMAGISKNESLEHFINHGMGKVEVKNWITDDGNFRKILMDNFRWNMDSALKYDNEIRDEYFPNIKEEMLLVADDDKLKEVFDEKLYRSFATFIHDVFFCRFYDNYRFGPDKTVHKKLYVFQFDHLSEISTVKTESDKLSYSFDVSTHGDDMRYLYCPTKIRDKYKDFIYEGASQNKEIREVMDHMCSIWANFCKDGEPRSEYDSSVQWIPYTEENPCYLKISNHLVLEDKCILSKKCHSLNDIVKSEPTVPSVGVSPEEDPNIMPAEEGPNVMPAEEDPNAMQT